jgi:hypothetical protein
MDSHHDASQYSFTALAMPALGNPTGGSKFAHLCTWIFLAAMPPVRWANVYVPDRGYILTERCFRSITLQGYAVILMVQYL